MPGLTHSLKDVQALLKRVRAKGVCVCAHMHGRLIYRASSRRRRRRRVGGQRRHRGASIERVLLALALAIAYLGGGRQTIQASIQLASHYVAMAARALSLREDFP